MEIAVSNRVIARNGIGQFRVACERAAERTIKRAVNDGAELSRSFAPVGPKHDERTIPLAASIKARMTGSTSGEWYSTARHALPQEFGAGPHVIAGNPHLRFFWEAAGRMFVPAEEFYHQPGLVSIVNHPGNPASPFLRPAYNQVMGRIMAIARAEFPG